MRAKYSGTFLQVSTWNIYRSEVSTWSSLQASSYINFLDKPASSSSALHKSYPFGCRDCTNITAFPWTWFHNECCTLLRSSKALYHRTDQICIDIRLLVRHVADTCYNNALVIRIFLSWVFERATSIY